MYIQEHLRDIKVTPLTEERLKCCSARRGMCVCVIWLRLKFSLSLAAAKPSVEKIRDCPCFHASCWGSLL